MAFPSGSAAAVDSRRRRGSGFKQGPAALNTWVTLAPERRAKRDRMAAATLALISALQLDEGTATVIYPNELVLIHGFDGPPLKRITGVAFSRLRPATGSQRMHDLLMNAVRAAAATAASSVCERVTAPPQPEVIVRTVANASIKTHVASPKPVPDASVAPTALVNSPTGDQDTSSVASELSVEPSPMASTELPECVHSISGLCHAVDEVLSECGQRPASVPRTPQQGPAVGRERSRSRSHPRKCRGESRRLGRVERAQTTTALRAATAIAARTFAGRSQLPLAELLESLQSDGSLDEFKLPGWDARTAFESLEAAQKIFVADDLVFSLA